ncbi:MAG: hypothetical protein AB1758_09985 [Candidatus Eremiobacterota bacterium]
MSYVLIRNRGTTFSNYRDAAGEPGSNQDTLQVYGVCGQPWLACGKELRRSTAGQRTSTWCAEGQR